MKWQTSWKQAFEEWGYGEAEGNLRPASLYDYDFEKAGDRSEAGRMATNATRYCEYYPQCELAFLKFDSNVLAGRLWNYAHGRVGWQQISEMKKAIVDYDTRFHNFKDSRKVALVHHHIHYLPGDGSDRLLLMTDAGPFWRAMIDMGVELILHGHKHYMTHAVIRYMMPIDETSTEGRELLILSAGTATSRDLPSGQRYSYYKIACDSFRYRIQQYFRSDVAFGPEGPPIIFRKIPRFSVPDTDPPVHSDTLESILVPDEDDFDAFHYPKIAYEGTIGEDLSYTAKVTFEGTRTNQPFLTVPLVILDVLKLLPEVSVEAFDVLGSKLLGFEILTSKLNVNKLSFRNHAADSEERRGVPRELEREYPTFDVARERLRRCRARTLYWRRG